MRASERVMEKRADLFRDFGAQAMFDFVRALMELFLVHTKCIKEQPLGKTVAADGGLGAFFASPGEHQAAIRE